MAITLNIPSQIEKYLSVAFFPATGNDFTLYIANDTNRLYQWNGADYVEVSQQDAVNWGSIGGDIINQTDLQLALAAKVDVEAGKGLSTNDYTTAEKNKLAGIEAGAQVNDVDSVNGYTGAVVLSKSDVGLSNADNTSDLNKPISTATQAALNTKQDKVYLHRTFIQGANVTGTTSEVQVFQLLIPANTFSASDKLSFFAVFSRVTATTLVSIRAKISTSATMPSGATSMIARVNPAASNLYAKIGRDMVISGGNVKGYPNNTTASSDFATSTAAISSQAMDVTVDNYFYLSVQLTAATDDVRLEAVEIKNI